MPNRLLSYTISANQPIIRRNLDAYSKAIDKMDARHEEAIKQKTALDIAFSQLDMNEAEDGWKLALRNQMQEEIDSAAMFGNYSGAYDTAILAAGKLMTNPGVIGRIRANAEYNQYKKTVENNNGINQVTKDRWLDDNRYHYEDKLDENGNVVGGSSWSPKWMPTNRVDLTEIYTRVAALAAKESGGSQNVKYLDEEGNLVDDPSKGFYGVAYKTGTQYERLSEDKLRSMFNAVFKQVPGAMESVMQDRDDRIWEYNKSSDEAKRSFIGGDIIDDSGAIKSIEDYLADRVNPVLKGMSYNNVTTSIDPGNAYAQRLQMMRAEAKEKSDAYAAYLAESSNTPALGANIIFSGEEHAQQTYTSYQSALNNLSSLFPKGFSNKELQKRLANGDYVGAGDMLRSWISNEKLRPQAEQAIARMIDSGNAFKQLTNGMSKDDIDAITFTTSLNNGSNLPIGNKYTEEFNKQLNKYLGDGSALYLHLNDVNNIHQLAKRYGGKVTPDGTAIAIPRSKAAHALNELQGNILHIGKPNKHTGKVDYTSISALGNANEGVPYTPNIAGGVMNMHYFGASGTLGIIDAAKTKTKKVFEENTTTEALSVDPHGNPSRQMAWNMRLNGQISGETFAKFDEHAEKMLKNAVIGAEFWQYPVYADKNNKDLRLITAKETQKLRDALDGTNDKDVEIYACNTSHGYGTYVVVNPHKNTKGGVVDRTVFFVQGLGDNKAANAIYQSHTGRASSYYNQLSGFGGSYTTTDGETFENINDKGGYYKGQFVDRNTIVKTMAASNQEEEVMRQFEDIANAGGTVDQSVVAQQVAILAQAYGYSPGTDAYNKYVNSRTYRILQQFNK